MVVFTVRFVVPIVVANKIVKRESIVSGYEVDARIGSPRGALIEIGAAGEAVRELG